MQRRYILSYKFRNKSVYYMVLKTIQVLSAFKKEFGSRQRNLRNYL